METRGKKESDLVFVVRKINKKYEITRKGLTIRYDIDEKRLNDPNFFDQEDTLDKLEHSRKIIKILEKRIIPHPLRDDRTKVAIFTIKIIQPAFDEYYKESISTKNIAPRIIASQFLDREALLKIADKEIKLPAFTDEHYFCRGMFKYAPREPVDWETVLEAVTEIRRASDIDHDKGHKKVMDTMYRINNKIKSEFGVKNDRYRLFYSKDFALFRDY